MTPASTSRARKIYDLNGEYDSAIADFDAALKLDNSPPTLIERATSQPAKGDYDRAVADYTAALAIARQRYQGCRHRSLGYL